MSAAVRYIIGEKCIRCFACIRDRICPEEAIIERSGVYSNDNGRRTDCNACFTGRECFRPVRAIMDKGIAV